MPFFPGICGVQSQAVWTTALMSSSTLRLLVRELLQNKYFLKMIRNFSSTDQKFSIVIDLILLQKYPIPFNHH